MRPSRSLLPAVLLVTALPAAGAQAAPHWGPPKQVVPGPAEVTASIGRPQAVTAPNGGLLAFGSDATNPLLLRGSIAGGLTAAKITSASAGAAQGATGADGTIAAVWSDRSTGRVAVVGPSGSFGAPVQLPGEGVNALDVGVSAAGTTTVAWRTKAPGDVYSVLVADIPKGGALGQPQVLSSGTGAVNAIDVAVAPNGAAAVAANRAGTGGYRTSVAFRPAGGAPFEAPQQVSVAGGDLDPRVSFEGDGTAVAAWGNANGGQVAQRRPGQPAFAPAQGLGGPAFSVDLEATPQGGSAIAFSGAGDVRAAVRAPGVDVFAPAPVGRVPGNIPADPAISVDAAGTAFVVFADSNDGAVKAVVGGTTTTLGFGRPNALTPAATAAGRANEAVALWVDAQGGLSSATFGEAAPPSTGPGPRPAGKDTRAPAARLVSSKRVTVSTRTTKLRLRYSCSEACAVSLTASLRTQPAGKRRRLAPVTPVPSRTARIRPAGRQTVTVTLGKLALADLRRALRAKRGAQLYVSAGATDTAGNLREVRSVLTLRAAKPKAPARSKTARRR